MRNSDLKNRTKIISGHRVHPRLVKQAEGFLRRRLGVFEDERANAIENVDCALRALRDLSRTQDYEFATAYVLAYQAERQNLLALNPMNASDREKVAAIGNRLIALEAEFRNRVLVLLDTTESKSILS